MATYTSSPKMQFFTSSGVPLIGGTLTVYSAGTTDLSVIYETVDDFNSQTNNIDNPVDLDSRGECQIVLSETSKFLLKDEDGNTIWTIDDISPNNTGDIFDINNNELIKFTTAANAVNEITVANANTGNSPSIKASGDDTNINLTIDSKGSGTINLDAPTVITGATTITGNTAVTGTLSATSTLSTAAGLTVATTAGITGNTTVGGTLGVTGATTLSSTLAAGATTITGAATISTTLGVTGAVTGASFNGFTGAASQSDQETGTSTTTWVTPANQIHHNSAAKAWANFGITGNINGSYGVSSITDVGTGDATVNFSTSFSSTNYSPQVVCQASSASAITAYIRTSTGFNTGSIGVVNQISSTGNPSDPSAWSVVCFGDR